MLIMHTTCFYVLQLVHAQLSTSKCIVNMVVNYHNNLTVTLTLKVIVRTPNCCSAHIETQQTFARKMIEYFTNDILFVPPSTRDNLKYSSHHSTVSNTLKNYFIPIRLTTPSGTLTSLSDSTGENYLN